MRPSEQKPYCYGCGADDTDIVVFGFFSMVEGKHIRFELCTENGLAAKPDCINAANERLRLAQVENQKTEAADGCEEK